MKAGLEAAILNWCGHPYGEWCQELMSGEASPLISSWWCPTKFISTWKIFSCMMFTYQEPISYHLSYNNLTLDVVRKLFQHCSIVIDGYMYAKCCYRWVSWALDRSKNYLHKLESQQCHFHWHKCGSTGYTNGAAWPGCYCTVMLMEGLSTTSYTKD